MAGAAVAGAGIALHIPEDKVLNKTSHDPAMRSIPYQAQEEPATKLIPDPILLDRDEVRIKVIHNDGTESVETVSPEEAEALLENSEPVYHRNNGFDKLQELHQPALQPALKEVPLPKAA